MLWTTGLGRFAGGFDPWTQLGHMENEMNRMLSRYASPTSGEFPAFNIWGSPDQAVVTMEMPGIDSNIHRHIGCRFNTHGARFEGSGTGGERRIVPPRRAMVREVREDDRTALYRRG